MIFDNINLKRGLNKILIYYLVLLAFIVILPFDDGKRKILLNLLVLSFLVIIIIPYVYSKSKIYSIDWYSNKSLLNKELRYDFRSKVFFYLKYLIFLLRDTVSDFYQDSVKWTEKNPLLILAYFYLLAKMIAYNVLFSIVPYTDVFKKGGIYANQKQYFTGVLIADILGIPWDSVHYLEIAQKGYGGYDLANWVFGPLYPYLIYQLNNLLNFIQDSSLGFIFDIIGISKAAGNFWALSAVLVANFFSFVAMIMFYKISLHYLDKKATNEEEKNHNKVKATLATAVFIFFPTNFAYMTVAYSEPVFISFCLIAWYCFVMGREKSTKGERTWYLYLAGISAALADLSRSPGIVLFGVLPMICAFYAFKYLYQQNWQQSYIAFKDGIKVSIALTVPFLWGLFISWHQIDTVALQKNFWQQEIKIPWGGINYFLDKKPLPDVLPVFEFWGYVLLIFFLLLGAKKYSWELVFYSLAFFGLYTSVTGIGAYAIVRYLGSIWPAFLIFAEMDHKDTRPIVWAIIGLFYVLGMYWMTRWALSLFWG